MFGKLLKKFFGSQSEREFKKSELQIDEINNFAREFIDLSDEQLQAKTEEFRTLLRERTADQSPQLRELEEQLRGDLEPDERERLSDELDRLDEEVRQLEVQTLNEIMPQAFALVKEVCRRLLGKTWKRAGENVEWDMVPYDVQLFGGIVLHEGRITEMATGEGKTLVATMPLYLNGLTGRGVHLITHNNYLALRDAMWMGPIYNFLGL